MGHVSGISERRKIRKHDNLGSHFRREVEGRKRRRLQLRIRPTIRRIVRKQGGLTVVPGPRRWHWRRSIRGGGTSDEGTERVQDQGSATLSQRLSHKLFLSNVAWKGRDPPRMNRGFTETEPCRVARVAEWLDRGGRLGGGLGRPATTHGCGRHSDSKKTCKRTEDSRIESGAGSLDSGWGDRTRGRCGERRELK